MGPDGGEHAGGTDVAARKEVISLTNPDPWSTVSAGNPIPLAFHTISKINCILIL